MSKLRRIVMVRHGETDGNSSVRFHGSGDVPLSDEGREQMREVARQLLGEHFDLVVASTLRRSWEAARIIAGGWPMRLEADFREIDFGRWEGLTAEEIEASDPILYRDWQEKGAAFDFPGGEPRADFAKRIGRGLERVLDGSATSALLVLHKGPIRVITEQLTGQPLEQPIPELAGIVSVSRDVKDAWFLGRRSSDPPGLGEG